MQVEKSSRENLSNKYSEAFLIEPELIIFTEKVF